MLNQTQSCSHSYRLRLRKRLQFNFLGVKYLRGRIYEISDHDLYLAMKDSREFEDAAVLERRTPAQIRESNQRGLEIQIARSAGLGDVLMMLPAAQEFARRNPHVSVSLAVPHAHVELLGAQQPFSRVVPYPPDRSRAIDLSLFVERHREQHHKARQVLFANGLGIMGTDREIAELRKPLIIRPEWKRPFWDFLRGREWVGEPLVALTRSGTDPRRSIDPELLGGIVQGLRVMGALPILLDTPGECSLAGKLTVAELAGAVSLCDLLIGPDTGTIHLAAHLGIPTVSIFTTERPHLRVSHYDSIAFEAPIEAWEVIDATLYKLRKKIPIAIEGPVGRSLKRAKIYPLRV